MRSVWAAVLIVLIILIAYYLYSKRIGSPANCNDYPGALNLACRLGVRSCDGLEGRDKRACQAAVRACMPATRASKEYAEAVKAGHQGEDSEFFNHIAPHIPPCVNATMKISPAGAAKALGAIGAVPNISPNARPFFTDPTTRANVSDLTDLIPGMTDWGLDFGRAVVGEEKESFAASEEAQPPFGPGHFPKGQNCYTDMGCYPNGRCMPDFPDDPTAGGVCVPA